MIRNGYYAMYMGIEYHLEQEMDSDRITIYTHDKRKADETFMQCNRPDERECYERYVQLWELEDTYSVITFVIEGEKDMTINTESTDMYCVCVGSEDQDLIEKYHFRQEDRGIYRGWIYKEGRCLREVITPLNLKETGHLKDRESLPGKGIRKTVPKVEPDTYLQKVIPAEEIPKYLGEDGYSTIQGFVARYDDVSHIKGYGNVVESFHLDDLVDGRRPFPDDGDSYGYIKFKTDNVDRIAIPFGNKQAGANADKLPNTLDGFTGVGNGGVITEWYVDGNSQLRPIAGAELHKVVNGVDTIIAIYREGHFKGLD